MSLIFGGFSSVDEEENWGGTLGKTSWTVRPSRDLAGTRLSVRFWISVRVMYQLNETSATHSNETVVKNPVGFLSASRSASWMRSDRGSSDRENQSPRFSMSLSF